MGPGPVIVKEEEQEHIHVDISMLTAASGSAPRGTFSSLVDGIVDGTTRMLQTYANVPMLPNRGLLGS